MTTDPIRDALVDLLDAVREVTCTLDHPEGWELGWHEAVELDKAERRARDILAANPPRETSLTALDIACPLCESAVGHPCMTTFHGTKINHPHVARIRAASAASAASL